MVATHSDGPEELRGGDELVRLRENVRAEPLINGFPAWPHLLAPHTYSRNLLHKHLPALHEAYALQRRGETDQTLAILELIEAVTNARPHLLEFASAIDELDQLLLRDEAKGFSLDSVYAEIPEAVRAYVELCYTRYNTPEVRFLEPLLYRSPLYDCSLQAVAIRLVNPDLPGLALRQPRVPGYGQLIRPAAFASPVWDVIGRARRAPIPRSELCAALDVTAQQLAPFVTGYPTPGVLCQPVETLQAKFMGHACVLIEGQNSSVLIDPLVAHRMPGMYERYSFPDLPERIECVAITHAHLDHLDIETLLQIRHLVDRVVVPPTRSGDLLDPSPKHMMHALGYSEIVELDDLDRLDLDGGDITAVPFLGEHGDLAIRGKSGYSVTIGEFTSLFLADSRCTQPRIYEEVARNLGPIGAIFLGMESEGSPLMTASSPYLPPRLYTAAMSESRRTRGSDAQCAVELMRIFRPAQAYIYAMGLEPWLAYMFGVSDASKTSSLEQVAEFIEWCSAHSVPAQLLRGCQPLMLQGAS